MRCIGIVLVLVVLVFYCIGAQSVTNENANRWNVFRKRGTNMEC